MRLLLPRQRSSTPCDNEPILLKVAFCNHFKGFVASTLPITNKLSLFSNKSKKEKFVLIKLEAKQNCQRKEVYIFLFVLLDNALKAACVENHLFSLNIFVCAVVYFRPWPSRHYDKIDEVAFETSVDPFFLGLIPQSAAIMFRKDKIR